MKTVHVCIINRQYHRNKEYTDTLAVIDLLPEGEREGRPSLTQVNVRHRQGSWDEHAANKEAIEKALGEEINMLGCISLGRK